MQYWTRVLTLSLLVKFHLRKLKPWFFQWSFFFLRSCVISINQPFNLLCNTIVMPGFFSLRFAWIYLVSCKAVGQRPKCRDWNLVNFMDMFYAYYLWRWSSELPELQKVFSFFSKVASFFCHYSKMLQRRLCQQFLSAHSNARMLSFCFSSKLLQV